MMMPAVVIVCAMNGDMCESTGFPSIAGRNPRIENRITEIRKTAPVTSKIAPFDHFVRLVVCGTESASVVNFGRAMRSS